MTTEERIERTLAGFAEPCSACDGQGAFWEESVEDDGYHGWWRGCPDCEGTGKEGAQA